MKTKATFLFLIGIFFSTFSFSQISSTGLQFNAMGDYVVAPSHSAYNRGTGDFTIEMWVRINQNQLNATAGLFEIYKWTFMQSSPLAQPTYINYYTAYANPPLEQTLRVHFGAAHLDYDFFPVVLNDGVCHHLAIVRASANLTLYIDGVSLMTLNQLVIPVLEPYTTGTDQNAHLAFGGSSFAGGGNYSGFMHEVRFWNIARSQADVQSTMNVMLAGNEPGLIGYWKFNDGSGPTVNDFSSNNNDGTLTAAANTVPTFIAGCSNCVLPPSSVIPLGPLTFCNSAGPVQLSAQPGYTYQWYKSGYTLFGETNSTLQVNSSGNYNCVISNTCGSVTSNTITVTVNAAPPALISASGSTNFCPPGSVVLSANTGSGLSYQWRLNNNPIAGATASSYIATVSGNYSCIVSSNCGSSTSNTITLNGNAAPSASITAGTTTVCAPGSITLQANMGGLSYQWKLNGGNISGATSFLYNATATGNYTCVVSNNCGSTTSNIISLTFNSAPVATITAGGSTTVCSPGSVTLNANTGSGLSYQWKLNGVSISGATASSYNASATGNYNCSVSNICGSTPSNTIVVTVATIPAQPGNIQGPTSVCHNQNNVIYGIPAVTGATSYTWTVPAGTQIKNGQGTVQIKVRFGNSAGNVTVRANNSCGQSPVRTLAIAMPCREGEEISAEDFDVTLYPNPATNEITIYDLRFTISNVEIFNAVGEKIFSQQPQTSDLKPQTVDVSQLPPGIYFITVTDQAGNKVSRKVVKM